MSDSSFDTSPASSSLDVVINVYYCLSLPFFLSFLVYFCYQYHSKFYVSSSTQTKSKITKTNTVARNVGLIKILLAIFSSSTWVNEIIFVFHPTPTSCYNGWKISSSLYVFAKFLVYVFLFQRGELVSIGAKTKFEKLIQFGTFGVPPIGIVGSIIGSGVYVDGICAIVMPFWLTILIMILDMGLSCGYLLMFVLKLRNLEQNLKIYRSTTSRKSRSEISFTETGEQKSNIKQETLTSHQRVQSDVQSSILSDETLHRQPSDLNLKHEAESPRAHHLNQKEDGAELEDIISPDNIPTVTNGFIDESGEDNRTDIALNYAASSNQPEESDSSATINNNNNNAPFVVPPTDPAIEAHVRPEVEVTNVAVPSPELESVSSAPRASHINSKASHNRTLSTRKSEVNILKTAKSKHEEVSTYRKVMQTHTKITAITCMSTIVCMLLLVLYNALDSRQLQMISGPFAGLDLFVNITAIAYMTRGTQKDHH